ncbi:arylsulfatase A [Penicillium canariense]|uniref:Arylsulfatase A n=1 Tax=Penicillium canariense TaxID=189055 RepID=A0A9W9IF90_9EURO|nr:arylsulfatase A [Penicillium canariense]KAJ5175139.1 arylsulfatase A [Penicillium canariense]
MVDLVPTVLQLCGVDEAPPPPNGMSLLPIIFGDEPHREFAFSKDGFLLWEDQPLLKQTSFPYDFKSKLEHEDTQVVDKAIRFLQEPLWTM